LRAHGQARVLDEHSQRPRCEVNSVAREVEVKPAARKALALPGREVREANHDAPARGQGNVKSFWSGWSVNLGDAIGPRERSPSGLWSRRFSNGVVYLLEPGAATQTISLPTTMKSATLGSVASVTLSARQGVVLTSP
jgi:hypothetical protein